MFALYNPQLITKLTKKMNNRQQFIKQFFSEIAQLNYTYLNFIGGNLEKINSQLDLAILIDHEDISFIDSVIKKSDEVDHTVMVSMSNMHQFAVLFNDGSSLDIDCMYKLTRRGMVYLSNDFVRKNTVTRAGVKCCNNKSFFELMMLYNQLNNAGMPQNYCDYFKSIPASHNIVSAFNEKYHAGFTIDNIGEHHPAFKTKLKSYLSIMKDNAFAENLKNTISYAKEKCTRVLTGREKIAPFEGEMIGG